MRQGKIVASLVLTVLAAALPLFSTFRFFSSRPPASRAARHCQDQGPFWRCLLWASRWRPSRQDRSRRTTLRGLSLPPSPSRGCPTPGLLPRRSRSGRHKGTVNSARFSRDGSRVLTAAADASARLWNGWTGAPLLRFEHPEIKTAKFADDDSIVITTGLEGLSSHCVLPPASGGSMPHSPMRRTRGFPPTDDESLPATDTDAIHSVPAVRPYAMPTPGR